MAMTLAKTLNILRSTVKKSVISTVDQVLREKNSEDSPWPTDRKLGLNDGAGYGYTDETLAGSFIAPCFDVLKARPAIAPFASHIKMPKPSAIPASTLCDGDVDAFSDWLFEIVCAQLGI